MPSTQVVSVSLTPALVAALKAIGEREGRKVSAVVEDALWRVKSIRDAADELGLVRCERASTGRPAKAE